MGLDKDNNTELACFVTGVAAILMGYSVYSHLKSVQDNNPQSKKLSNKPETKIEDVIHLKSLAYLMQSPNANIQSCAAKVILERAMSSSQLSGIISACDKSQPMNIRSKSLSSLQLLTRKEGNKAALLESGALNVLVDALKCTDPEMKEVTQRYVAVAICDLIQGSDINKYKIIGMGVLDSIQRILSSREIRNNELKYWTLMILYQISLSDPLPHILVENGFVKLLAKMARLTYGNTNMPKFCMQSLVRITANVDVTDKQYVEAKAILVELLDYNILDLISICLRGDDVELIYWAAGLMHEFVIKDVAADKFRQIRGIHTILSGLLSAEEMYVSRVILRTIKFMAYGQDRFLQEMVRSGMVKKIMHCLSLNDEDIRQWAVLCIHVVAGQVESHQDIISATEFEVLLELAISSKMKVAIYVSDILSLICCITSNSAYLDPHIKSLLKTLNTLLVEGETDVQYNAAGAIFNIMTTNAPFANKVRQICFKNLLLMSSTSTNERVRMICTKGALMVVIKNRYMVFQINSQVTDPLIETVNSLSRWLLPIMISQALTGAYKRRSSDVTSRPADTIEENVTESDEEDIRVPRAGDYIDVTEQGTITNASRLDRVLKNRERAKKKRKGQQPASEGVDLAYLFEPYLSIQERDARFQGFKLPPLPRDQLTATLTALNILLENDQVIGSVMTEKHSSGHPTLLDMMDDVVAEDPSEASTVYSRLNLTGHRPLAHTPHYAADTMALPSHIQHVTQHLVHLVLYPALDAWAESRWSHHSLTALTESKASDMYQDVLQWIYRFSELPKGGQESLQRPRFHENRTGSIGDTSSEEEDEGPMFSLYTKKKQDPQQLQTSKKYHGFSRRALILLQSLTRYASVRNYLIQDLQFIKVLFYLLEADSTSTERVMTCLGTLFAHDPQLRIPKHEFQILAILVWHGILFSNSRSFCFYSRFVLTYCSRSVIDRTTSQMINHASRVEIDLVSRSKFCLVNYASCLHVRNDSWTFETVRATHGVPSLKKDRKGHCYAYEVRLESGGLMQVGWVTDHFEFDPEGGKGVGDDVHSFGYDGSRAKKWHGKYANMRTTSYGMIWHEGDIVTCAIDLEKGELRYFLNGTDLGVAFFGITTNRSWYPAISLATGQQCKLHFGGPTDPLKHMPEGYLAISTLANQSLFNMELPPPRMAKQISIEETDLTDLSKAMEHMSFKSPVLNDGNAEPSLKPIDSVEPVQNISTSSEQFSFYFMKSSMHEQSTLSSVYYEISLEFPKEDSLNVSSLNESVMKFGLQCLGPQSSVSFEYHTLQKHLTFVIGSDRSEAFEFEIKDGDCVGLLYVSETNAFGITLNGQVQFFIYVGKNIQFEPYLPFVSGLMKNDINYGEEPFAWVFANHPTSKQHRSSYLYKLVGKISKF